MKTRVIIFATIIAIILSSMCAMADTKTDLLGTEYSGDITFNDIEWLTSREDVVSALKEKFSDVDIEEVVAWDEKQYMDAYVSDFQYRNKHNKEYFTTVGEMKVSNIRIMYVYEEGKYDGIYQAWYEGSGEYKKYEAMYEMLKYKYGNPYSITNEVNNYSGGSGSEYDTIKWKSSTNGGVIELMRYYVKGYFGSSSDGVRITYYQDDVKQYVDEMKEKQIQKENDETMGKKDYSGL